MPVSEMLLHTHAKYERKSCTHFQVEDARTDEKTNITLTLNGSPHIAMGLFSFPKLITIVQPANRNH